jgi:hypothetical protein
MTGPFGNDRKERGKIVALEEELAEAATAFSAMRERCEALEGALSWSMRNLRSGLNQWCGDHDYHKARAILAPDTEERKG